VLQLLLQLLRLMGVVVVVQVEVELAVTSGEKSNHKSHDLLRVGLNDFEFFLFACHCQLNQNHDDHTR
jgi:hypothetical protein